MVNGLFILSAIILVVLAIAIRRDLAKLEAQAKMVAVAAPEPALKLEPVRKLKSEPADSFEDDREITGQLVTIAEYHCQPKRSGGKRKDWRKKPKGKRREAWIREEAR